MTRNVPLAGLLALCACATIVHGGHEKLTFGTTPPGARVFIDDTAMGTTPTTITFSRKKEHLLRIELEGYKPYTLRITRHTSDWVWANLLVGGVIGVAIDAGTGAMYKLYPKDLRTVMVASGDTTAAVTAHGGQLRVAIVLRPDPTWEKVGQLTR